MDLIKHRALLYPLLLMVGLFLADKIFYLKPVRDITQHYQKSEPDFYDSREAVLKLIRDQMPANQAQGRHVGLILGSSRSGGFAPADIRKYRPDLVPYNFSVPMGGMAHFLYWTERTLQAGIHPDLLLVETDPANFAAGSLSFMLQYDFDPIFVLRNTSLFARRSPPRGFTPEDADTFFLKYSFGLSRYPVDARNIVENFRRVPGGGGHIFLDIRWHTQKLIDIATREHLGAIPTPIQVEATEAALEQDAKAMESRIFSGRPYSPEQLYFFERLVDLAIRERISLILYRPVVSDPFAKVLRAKAPEFHDVITELLRRKLSENTRPAGPPPVAVFLDPEEHRPLTCRAFVDALHLSGRCYPELTERIFGSTEIR